MDEKELKSVLDDILSTTAAMRAEHEKGLEEARKAGEEHAETKQIVDRMAHEIGELELRFQRLSLERPSEKVTTPEMKAFLEWARSGRIGPDEAKLLRLGDDETGGYFAPVDFVDSLIEAATIEEPLLSLVSVRRTMRASVAAPTRTQRAVAVWDADQDFTTETTGPKYGREEIPTHGAHAIVDIEREDLEDTTFDLEADLRREWARGFGIIDGVAVVTGSGVARPKGITLDTDVETINSGTSGALTYAGFLNAVDALKPGYRAGATWVLNRTSIGDARLIQDAASHYIWTADLTVGSPGTILGFPYRISENVAAIAAAAKAVLFGDFSQGYWLVERLAVEVQRDEYTQWPKVRFKARRRVGGQVVLPEAIKIIVLSV